MKLRAYCIYDNKALAYHPPFFAGTDASAVRSLQDVCNDMNTTIGRHPGDFALYCVGEFDDASAYFVSAHPIVHIVDAVTLVSTTQNLPLFKENEAA